MAGQGWSAPPGVQRRTVAIGASYNTSTTATDVSYGAFTNPIYLYPGELNTGTSLIIRSWGTYAVNATTPNLTLGLFLGGAAAGVALVTSTARAVTNSATVNWPWSIYYEGTVFATGTSGSIEGHGWYEVGTSLTAVTRIQLPETALAAVTIDTTIQKAVTTVATWGTSAAGNIVFCRGLIVETIG